MRRSGYQSTFHIYIIFFILLTGTVAAGFGMLLYNITIKKPDGQIDISSWPVHFTENFSEYVVSSGNRPRIKQSGLKLLQDNGLWLQILDENGKELQSFRKPPDIPSKYSPSELIHFNQEGIGEYSVFAGNFRSGSREWTYMIGFPIQISKITMFFNKDRFNTLKPLAYGMLLAMLLLLLISGLSYSYIITKRITQIRRSIREIAERTFIPDSKRGFFSDIHEELKLLNAEIKSSDEARLKNDRLREEWIANITHDLKTPLSPIRGYAELLSDPDSILESAETRRYGGIILKNTAFTEELINDLKLTYQLKNEMLPLHREKQNMVRFIKELIIDLLNNPEYESRNISFCSSVENMELSMDSVLLKRALNNLLANALIHNSRDTQISVSIKAEDIIQIIIEDNGRGLTEEERSNLFVRYYRGSRSGVKSEGSGLGMAIARQIIELHGGSILVRSEPGSGTCMIIELPGEN